MKTNVGAVDRAVRIVAGLILLALFWLYPAAPWRMFALVGIIPLVTGLIGSCPLYSMLGLSTCPAKRR
nr:DUF2892 domain-containing protein [Hoeflea marina]